MNRIKPFTYSNPIQGVQVKPLSEDGKEVSILYNGLLAQSGAGQIYLHFGFGDKQKWDGVINQPMEAHQEGWTKNLFVKRGNQINFCFKDGADSWDNNNGNNWAYRVEEA